MNAKIVITILIVIGIDEPFPLLMKVLPTQKSFWVGSKLALRMKNRKIMIKIIFNLAAGLITIGLSVHSLYENAKKEKKLGGNLGGEK